MGNLYLVMNYRWNGTIITGISRYLGCKKIANGLSPITMKKKCLLCNPTVKMCINNYLDIKKINFVFKIEK